MATIQLSDTQSVILSAACAREGGLVLPITTSLKGGAVDMVLTSMIKKGLIEAIPAEVGIPVWREAEDGTPLTLVSTAAAYTALGIVADTGADTAPEEEPATDMADEAESPPTDAHVAKPARKPREGTKQEALISMLKRPEGASIAEIMEATAWQAHSIRGFIAGALKKKLGLNVTSEKIETRGRVYRIAQDVEAAA
ncbi:MAG: DUF3489 domain-containing protein [Magnetospirillum sp.]|uniref:DUF3489 domain-containing protein n=1 Tax=Paramagnetospirillum magnetotacticum MS-1 TaxID=272627 RepID=A0A0C2UZL5_PARME|nr:DUF3489 domain-containing protein [Paramagnetospirillum magnetotacticum]KIL98266.1 hypothetical protein CCC_01327 [Paramagnetospirillum magnetotacticum MS-1]MBI3446247.1 DUF3489 domain-containing protein [Magnetospirillum sp.]